MKQKKWNSGKTLIVWFLAVMIFLSAWNADRFYYMMERDLPGITLADAKERTDRWDSYYTRYFRFMEPLAEVSGVSYLAMGKTSTDNYTYAKDKAGNLQLREDGFDRERSAEQMYVIAEAFASRGIPFVFAALPPRFEDEDFLIGTELSFFGSHDAYMLQAAREAGIDTLDVRQKLINEGLRHQYSFKTDIHLETEGEVEAARVLSGHLASLGIEIRDRDIIFDRNNYNVETQRFAGNLVKSSGIVYTHGSDAFELWYPNFHTDLTVESPARRGARSVSKSGQFSESVMNGMEPRGEGYTFSNTQYWVLNYLQYPSAYCTVENNMHPDGARLLVIMDSYATRMASYLSLGAGHITVIDPRGDGSAGYLFEAMENGEYDAVVMAAGTRDFYDKIYEAFNPPEPTE
ncbi:MAG: hypothetical protein FWH32_02910 [Clostridiales bacterium]|nr:hypothetical protein [Clostridiales bacterium]